MRETAFDPPPPTPTTLIVADPMFPSIGVFGWSTIVFVLLGITCSLFG
jgi:hypothetical protein